jgi:hypothetical protein
MLLISQFNHVSFISVKLLSPNLDEIPVNLEYLHLLYLILRYHVCF